MTSHRTPDTWDGAPRSWGPVEQPDRLLNDRLPEIVAKQLQTSVDEAADMLLARPMQHRYLWFRRLGRTKHSEVYAAVDQLLAREVALKLHQNIRPDDSERRVLGEARMMSLFEHPNIVRLIDFGEHEGTWYSVAELCDADMTAWAKDRPWTEVVDRILEAGRGLAALHEAGYVHGDIKPANVLVRDGVAKVADFGTAAAAGLAFYFGGTPGYIAPEVADGLRSPAADVFGLAATAWACVFEQPAFGVVAKDDPESAITVLLDRARNRAIVEPRLAGRVPRRLTAVLRRGLDPDLSRRPGLERFLADLGACRPIAHRWRASGAPRPTTIAAVACLFSMCGAGGHAVYVACTASDPAPQVEVEVEPTPEPEFGYRTVALAVELAQADDPLGVWGLYWPLKAEWSVVEPERVLGIAARLITDAESGAADNPAISAEIAKRLASGVRPRALRTGDFTSDQQAVVIVGRCDAVLNRSNLPSRPD